MRFIFTLVTLFFGTLTSIGQINLFTSGNGSIVTNVGGGPGPWFVGPFSSSSTLNGSQTSQVLEVTGFTFPTPYLPGNVPFPPVGSSYSGGIVESATITSFDITINRSASEANRIEDAYIGIRVNGVTQAIPTASLNPVPSWPTTSPFAVTYSIPNSFGATTAGVIADFGILLQASRILGGGGGNTVATVGTIFVTINYSLVLPVVLESFDVNKTADNHVKIDFSTSSEENVKNMYIERSTDGRTFTPLFTIAPKGGKNVTTKYSLLDKTPVTGTNYYRLKEVDRDGKMMYFETKSVAITRGGSRFQAFYNGADVKVNVSGIKGKFSLMLHDVSGALLASQSVNITGSSLQTGFTAPQRPGVYFVSLRGEGFSETTRIFVGR